MRRRLSDYTLSVFRVTLAGNAIASWYNSQVDPGSRFFKIGQSLDGGVLMWLMALFAVSIILDTVLNDWTKDVIRFGRREVRLHWKRAFTKRHYLLVGLACCYWAQPYVALRAGRPVESLATFAWVGITIFVLAFFDAKQRSRDAQCLKTAS